MKNVFRKASDLWQHLVSAAGIDEQRYDGPLVSEIKERLKLPTDIPMAKALKREAKSADALIRAFLETAAPYSEMMVDLLAMFATAGARETNENVLLQFDFGAGIPAATFDVRQFRKWSSSWKQLLVPVRVLSWDIEQLWPLVSAFDGPSRHSFVLGNETAKQWLACYDEERRWPTFVLPPPEVAAELVPLLGVAWSALEGFLREAGEAGPLRADLEQAVLNFGPRKDVEEPDRARLRGLRYIDSDGWAGSLVAAAYGFAENAPGFPTLGGVRTALEQILAHVPQETKTVEARVEVLDELLNLPIWKQRSELYSVWVGSQIVRALASAGLPARVHQHDGKIVYRFSGTHLATAGQSGSESVQLWAELKSPLHKPRGKGRSNSIQPDYTLTHAPVTEPASSVLVVECKQYLKTDIKKFSAALEDYARGRVNALVILVNYGPISKSLLDDVDPAVRARARALEMVRPRSPSLAAFHALVGESVKELTLLPLAQTEVAVTTPLAPPTLPTFLLRWTAPVDLDFHLLFESSIGEKSRVYYQARGNLHLPPFVALSEDQRQGGAETIQLGRTLSGRYLFAVHHFASGNVATANATIDVALNGLNLTIPGPRDLGAWWIPFAFHGDRDVLELIGTSSNLAPL